MAISATHQGWRRLVDSTNSDLGAYSVGQRRFELGNNTLTAEGANTAALLFGAGTSTTRVATATTGKNFIGFWLENAATSSGDCRGLYLRQFLTGGGSGVGGEAARIYTTVDSATAFTGSGIHGAHITASLAASASVTGLMAGLRATLDWETDTRTPSGTHCAIQADSNIGANNTVDAAKSFIRFSNEGAVKLETLFDLPNADTSALYVGDTDTVDKGLRIRVNGAIVYLAVTTALS